MRLISFFLLILIPLVSSAKRKQTHIYGRITTRALTSLPKSNVELGYSIYRMGKPWIYSNIEVDLSGNYSYMLPKGAKIMLTTLYRNFYRIDTIFRTGNLDSIRIDFEIIPVTFKYTKNTAIQSIQSKDPILVTHDKLLADICNKRQLTKELGFKYKFEKHPFDKPYTDSLKFIWQYNKAISEHLDSILGNQWKSQVDSLLKIEITAEIKRILREDSISITNFKLHNTLLLGYYHRQKLKRTFSNLRIGIASTEAGFIPKQWRIKKALRLIDNSQKRKDIDYAQLILCKYPEEMIPELIVRLANHTEVGLNDNGRIYYQERVESGDLNPDSLGMYLYYYDDLFRISGRAGNLLWASLGQYFGHITMNSSSSELEYIQLRWLYWYRTHKK